MLKQNISITNNNEFAWRLLCVLCSMSMVLMIVTDVAFASGANDVVGHTLCRLVGNLTGGIARGIATLAIFAVGIGLFLGKVNWGIAATTAAGVGIIFAAPTLVAWLSGATDTTCATSSLTLPFC